MVLPVAVLIVLGLLDLGRAVFAYNTLAQAARQAARVAIVNQNTTDIRNQAMNSATSLGLTASNVSVCFKDPHTSQQDCSSSTDDCPQSERAIGCLVLVRTQLSYAPMTPIVSIFWSSISLSSTSVLPIEYVCPNDSSTVCP